MTLDQAQQSVDEWIKINGVRYFNELTNMAMLTEEVGEVARIIGRRYGEQSEKESDKNKDLGDEFADVLWVLICLANQTGVNLTEAFNKNMEKKTQRDIADIGSHVTIQEEDYDPETYHIVGPKEADPRNARISHESPIGRALIGHRVGETVAAETPNGTIRFKIIKID